MIHNFDPLGDRVLVRRLAPETTSPGGLYWSPDHVAKQRTAVVVKVGPGRQRLVVEKGKSGKVYKRYVGRVRPVAVKPGDTVLLAKYGGHPITLDGVEHVIVPEELILGVFAEAT